MSGDLDLGLTPKFKLFTLHPINLRLKTISTLYFFASSFFLVQNTARNLTFTARDKKQGLGKPVSSQFCHNPFAIIGTLPTKFLSLNCFIC